MKNVWNLHLLDKLYFIDHQDKFVDDTPVMSLEVDDRDVLINGIVLPGSDSSAKFVLNAHNIKFFFNKEDAEAELETWKFSAKTPMQ
jgi:hypothetical protein